MQHRQARRPQLLFSQPQTTAHAARNTQFQAQRRNCLSCEPQVRNPKQQRTLHATANSKHKDRNHAFLATDQQRCKQKMNFTIQTKKPSFTRQTGEKKQCVPGIIQVTSLQFVGGRVVTTEIGADHPQRHCACMICIHGATLSELGFLGIMEFQKPNQMDTPPNCQCRHRS